MIDTNKYEGYDNWEGTKVNMANEANVQLIADAPLILEEVKRLRKGIKQMADIWLDNSHDMDGREKLIKMTNQLRELVE